MMKLRIFSLLSLAVLSTAAVAQGVLLDDLEALGEGADLPEIRRYSVEIIVFRYTQDVGTGSEIFVPELIVEPGLLSGEDGLVIEGEIPDDSVPPEEPQDDEAVQNLFPGPVEFATLPEAEYTLGDTLERLQRIDAYEPLMHFGWIQAMYPDQETPVQPLARFAAPAEGLDGTLQLYLSRYLHLVVDLSLAADDGAESPFLSPGYRSQPRSSFDDSDTFVPEARYAPLAYQIVEDRIMKNGETRYYDHPKFGVIAKIMRIEEPDEASASGSAAVN